MKFRYKKTTTDVMAWGIPLTTQGMGKEILGLVSGVNQLLSIIRLLLRCNGVIRLCDDNVVKDAENNYEKISSSLPSSWYDAFRFNADLCSSRPTSVSKIRRQ
ncbi:hypothetical protein [Xenorhabdus stockiae]|uniref:hypothetical protein n=1 Tax=Xenorhabdus stockiae TaxID=351614 RepID=UPI0040646FFE